jgi:hypothetical protein
MVETVNAEEPKPAPIDMTQLAELARLTPAERFRRAVESARNLAPFMGKVAARSQAERDEPPG